MTSTQLQLAPNAVLRAPDNREKRTNTVWCYLFMLPTIVLASVFTFYPAIASWIISFQDWNGFGDDRAFIGLQNFREVIADPYFWSSFGRTALFVVLTVPASLIIALLIAIALNDASYRLRPLFRAVFFLPVVTTTAVVGIVATMILNPFDGPLNSFLLNLGLIDRPIDFLGNPDIALWSVSGVFVWKWMGISMIYWLVALQTVPRELYEAASVDGAGVFRRHRHLTVPMIAPFAAIITLIAVVGSFQTFPLVQAMTQGGPSLSTELVELYIYRLAFASSGEPRLGYASAAAVVFGVIILILTALQAWGIKRVQASRGDQS